MKHMPMHFSPAAIKFLRGLKRHNDRTWFNERKAVYEQELKAPMLDLIAEVNEALLRFAPEHVRPPEKCMMRIYRDIRFSHDKRPYKHQIASWWARHGLEKTSGAGFYFHLSSTDIHISAGAYMPQPDQTLAIRRHLLEHHEEFRHILERIALDKRRIPSMMPIDGLKLVRAPKGFPAGHPAIDLIVQRQWGVSSSLPMEAALEPTLLKQIVSRFQLAAPLVAFLNAPMHMQRAAAAHKPLF